MKKKVGITGGRFRSYDLWVVIHNHHQIVPPHKVGINEEDGIYSALPLRHTGMCCAAFNVKRDDTGGWVRTNDL